MKINIIKNITFLLFGCSVAIGCVKSIDNVGQDGEVGASVSFAVNSKTNDNVEVGKKSQSDNVPQFSLTIVNDKNQLIVQEPTLKDDAAFWLLAKDYTAKIVSGKSVKAAFDAPYYEGEVRFKVLADRNVIVPITAKLKNIKVSVVLTDNLKAYMKDAETIVSVGANELSFGFDELRAGYFEASADIDGTTFNWACSLEPKVGPIQTEKGVISQIKPNTHVTLTLDVAEDGGDKGGFRIMNIVVKEDVVRVDDNIEVPIKQYPDVYMFAMDINELHTSIPTNPSEYDVYVRGYTGIKNLRFSFDCPWLKEQLGGVAVIEDVLDDLDNLPKVINDMKTLGLTIAYGEQSAYWDKSIKITFSKQFMTDVPTTGDGSYSFTFEVIGNNGKKTTQTLRLASVAIDAMISVPSWNIFATKADFEGKWMTEIKPSPLGFEFCEDGFSDWQEVSGNLIRVDESNKTFSATVTGLDPNKTYSVRAITGLVSNTTKFTTDQAPQLYNSGFNLWSKSGNAWYARESANNSFWDSGNKGSTTVGSDNPTEPEYTDVVEGTSALKLTSKYIVVAFAAGNLFSGEFHSVNISSKVPDMTFGRSFSGKPYSLKGKFKYNSVSIDNGSHNGLNGKPDRYNMLIMVTGSEGMPLRFNSSGSPFNIEDIMKTGRSGKIEVIASGMQTSEKIEGGIDVTQAVSMSDYQDFEIVLKYHAANAKIKPAYVIVVFSASKYGDYFTGGKGSCLLIDDMSLDYNFKN